MRPPTATAATPTTTPATTTAPSRITARRSGSMPATPSSPTIGASPMRPRATSTTPSPTSARRSGSIPRSPSPISAGASQDAPKAMPPAAMPTSPRPGSSIRTWAGDLGRVATDTPRRRRGHGVGPCVRYGMGRGRGGGRGLAYHGLHAELPLLVRRATAYTGAVIQTDRGAMPTVRSEPWCRARLRPCEGVTCVLDGAHAVARRSCRALIELLRLPVRPPRTLTRIGIAVRNP